MESTEIKREWVVEIIRASIKGESETAKIREVAKREGCNRIDLHFAVQKGNRNLEIMMEAGK